MDSVDDRYERSARLFGAEGQRRMRAVNAILFGVSGLGSPLAQQIGFLGVQQATPIDPEELDNTNRNRFVGGRHTDPVPGSPKVDLAARMIREMNPDVIVTPIQDDLVSERAFEAVRNADWVLAGFDHDGPRFILNELCAAYDKPYIDLASDVDEDGSFGGRIFTAINGDGCLHCMNELDMSDVETYLRSEEERRAIDAIYGVKREALGETGPSVAPLNGVIANMAALEFMCAVTGLRAPERLIHYYGDRPMMTISGDKPPENCYYCKVIRGTGADADVERYLRIPHLKAA